MSRIAHNEGYDTHLASETPKTKLTRRKFIAGAMMASMGLTGGVRAEGSDEQSANGATQNENPVEGAEIAQISGVQYTINPNLYAGYESQDPEDARILRENCRENGDFEEFIRSYNVTTEAAPGWEPSWSEFQENRGFENSVNMFADRFAAALNTGCTYADAEPYLPSEDVEGYVDWVVAQDAPVVRGLYGLEGRIVGAIDDQEYDDDWIRGSMHFKSFVAAHRAVLTNYFNTLLEKSTLDQSIRVRPINSELNDDAKDDGYYSVTATFQITHEVNGGTGQSEESSVEGSLYVGFFPKEELGLNTIVLPAEKDRLELFRMIALELK